MTRENEQEAPAPFSAALVLGLDGPVRGVDRHALRMAGVRQVAGLASGAEALALLTGPGHIYDLVLCDEQLSDMSGHDFLCRLNQHGPNGLGPNGLGMEGRIPVIMVAREPTEKMVLASIGVGCAGFLARPYTVISLEQQLQRARAVFACGPADMLGKAYEILVEAQEPAEVQAAERRYIETAAEVEAAATTAFREGTDYLLRKQWDKAIEAFGISMRSTRLEADACLGMAKAWEGKGRPERAREYNQRAGTLFMRARKWARAREAFARALAESTPGSPNPLLTEALDLIKQNQIDHAAQALIHAYDLPNTDRINIHRVAHAASATRDPEQTIKDLCLAVHRAGDHELGDRLRRRLLSQSDSNTEGSSRRTGLLASFPRLQDAVNVAKFTASCWKDLDDK